jgi:hypothetical protein
MNNQPAFPGQAQVATNVDIHEGMSLREYFAAKAMQAWIAKIPGLGLSDRGREEITSESYAIADAMIEEGRKATIIADAIATIIKATKADDDYAWTWHANIAVCFMDEGGSHEAANCAAARFMKTCFDVDVTKLDQWRSFVKQWAAPGVKGSTVKSLAEINPEASNSEPTTEQIDAACLRFNSYFENLPAFEKEQLRANARDWLFAWKLTAK